ncbi:hypothetical protein ScPMuIL_005429 [Solemya velum]
MASAETQKPGSGRRSDQLPRTENDFGPSCGAAPRPASEEQSPQRQSPRRPTRQLDFYQAMSDFKKMFPTLDSEVIEAVLRANDGAVDATIDQLLTMTIDADEAALTASIAGHTADFEESIPKYSEKADSDSPPSYSEAMRTHTQSSMWTSPLSSTCSTTKKSPITTAKPRNILDLDMDELVFSNTEVKKPIPPSSSAVLSSTPSEKKSKSKSKYRNWNPPMLGTLPDDFLRLTPPSLSQKMLTTSPTRSGSDRMFSSFTQHSYSASNGEHGSSRSAEKSDKVKSHSSKSEHKRRVPHRSLSMPGTQTHAVVSTRELSSDLLHKKMKENEKRRRRISLEMDPELSQYLEDERLAILLQNSEFLEELRRNEDFMKTLEKDRMNASAFEPTHLEPPPTVETVIPAPEIDSVGRSKFTYKLQCTNYAVQHIHDIEGYGTDNQNTLGAFPFSQPVVTKDEDAELRGKLKHMGRASRKQFAALAKRFFTRRKKKSPKQMLKENIAPSMVNLLDEEEEDDHLDLPINNHPGCDLPHIEPLPGSFAHIPAHRTVQRPPYHPQTVISYPESRRQDIV